MKEISTNSVTKSTDGRADWTMETVAPGQESSVEITQNAKGEKKITVKVYHADPYEAARQAQDIYSQMEK